MLRTEASDGRRNKRQAACVINSEGSLVGLLGLAALLLLLALACRLATGLHLVDDEACVALLAIPLEAFEVGVCQLVVGLEEKLVYERWQWASTGGKIAVTHLLLELLVDGV